MRTRIPHLLPVLAGAALALASAGCVVTVDAGQYSAREEKHWTVTGTPDVTLVTFDGAVEVRSWDKPEVRIEIEKRASDKALADKIEVGVEQSGNRIAVEAKKPPAVGSLFGMRTSPSVKIVAILPRQSNLVVRSGDGSITVERVEGRLELNTGDGGLVGRELSGTIRAHTGDGFIRFEDVDGTVDLDSGDGTGELNGKLKAVRLRTGDGRLVVRAENGSAMTDDWEIRTGDGGLSLELPDGFAANLDASTGDGHVSLEGFGELSTTANDDEATQQALRRSLGTGGRLLRLRSGSGGITIRKL